MSRFSWRIFRENSVRFADRFLATAGLLILLAMGGGELSAQSMTALAETRSTAEKAGGTATAGALPVNLFVDTANREEVRVFFRAIYSASDHAAMSWTGDYAAEDTAVAAGDTSAAFQEAVNLRVNFFRALAGVPADVAFYPAFSFAAQKAALMMSVNDALSHGPLSNWIFYTAEGAAAAAASNLALGIAGPGAIDGYIADAGRGNAPVGHRRWLLYPQTEWMGTGDVAGDDMFAPANALWVLDANLDGPRPPVREGFVAWPPPGYVPYPVVYPRWSISYPDADFSGATVTMRRNGLPVPVTLGPVSDGFGENTLVWSYDDFEMDSGQPHARPVADITYEVEVSDVAINGRMHSYTYAVLVFDPDTTGPDHKPLAIAGSVAASPNAGNTYTVGGLDYASGFQWRVLTSSAFDTVEGAEPDGSGLSVFTTGNYPAINTVVHARGSASFHLAHPTPHPQYVQLAPTFLGTPAAQLAFASRLGYATAGQTARVQVSLDEGTTWVDVFEQAGSGGAGERDFSLRAIPLSHLAGRTFLVRFAYTFSTGSYFPGATTGVGWHFDDITLSGVNTIQVASVSGVQTGNQFTYAPRAAGVFGLQARGIFYDLYPLDWGSVKVVSVTNPAPLTVHGTR